MYGLLTDYKDSFLISSNIVVNPFIVDLRSYCIFSGWGRFSLCSWRRGVQCLGSPADTSFFKDKHGHRLRVMGVAHSYFVSPSATPGYSSQQQKQKSSLLAAAVER